MPFGLYKNIAYGALLSLVGMKPAWQPAAEAQPAEKILFRHHVIGASLQCFEGGQLTRAVCVGHSRLNPSPVPVRTDTVFRTASLAKTVTALLVLRLWQIGKIELDRDISDELGYSVRNPRYPKTPITLRMLMNHTSSIRDCEAYYASLQHPTSAQKLLMTEEAYKNYAPGTGFEYSNFAAGLIGCILEKRFGKDLDDIAREELFKPLHADASYRIEHFPEERLSDCYRVLPKGLGFDSSKRLEKALTAPVTPPDSHYTRAAGNLYLTAEALARLAILAATGLNGFLNSDTLAAVRTFVPAWKEGSETIEYGPGLFRVTDPKLLKKPIFGHLGFAYGAVNSLFFDEDGNGFVLLTSGASEKRTCHLSSLNRELIPVLMPASAKFSH